MDLVREVNESIGCFFKEKAESLEDVPWISNIECFKVFSPNIWGTPLKINMEPKHHPIEKEMLIFQTSIFGFHC